MAERDLGSTFLLPHTHLYKPDRVGRAWPSGSKRDWLVLTSSVFQGSDISGFDSL